MAPTPKDRVKPTHYPTLPFHTLRSAQLVSSLVVAGIIGYFMKSLLEDGYKLPWTFILLFTVSLLSILTLTATTILHCISTLNPLHNTIINSATLILWTVSTALLTWYTSWTLGNRCDDKTWFDGTGVSVCHLYKTLFSFALFGFLSNVAALGLDVVVLRRGRDGRGKFEVLRGGNGGGVGEKKGGKESVPLKSNPGWEDMRGQGEDTGYYGPGGRI